MLTPSHDQVREPMNRRGIGRWKDKQHLGPVLAAHPSTGGHRRHWIGLRMTAPPPIDGLLREPRASSRRNDCRKRPSATASVITHRATLASTSCARVAGGRNDHVGVVTAIDAAIAKGLTPPPQIVFARIHAQYTLAESKRRSARSTPSRPRPDPHWPTTSWGSRRSASSVTETWVTFGRCSIALPTARVIRPASNDSARTSTDGRRSPPSRGWRGCSKTPGPSPRTEWAGLRPAKLLDGVGRYDEAFEAAIHGNNLASPSFDAAIDAGR